MRSLLMVFFTVAVFFAACKDKQPEATVSDPLKGDSSATALSDPGMQIEIDKSASKIKWTGRKGIAGSKLGSHHGAISFADEPTLTMKDGKIASGKFTFDMKSITVNDLKHNDGKDKLEADLKSNNFFNVEAFPKGEFEIVEVGGTDSVATIKGNLTLLGITKGISFPAQIKYNHGGKTVKANATFEIDRTEWNIVYGNDKSLKDKFIHPKIEIELEIVSKQ